MANIPVSADAKLARIVGELVAEFYAVVDRRWSTFCVVDSLIVTGVLAQLGIDSQVIPCQIVCSAAGSSYMIGFSGLQKPDQWDGHVAVRCHDVLIDCATGVLAQSCGVAVPNAVATDCLKIPSSLIARLVTDGGVRLGWLVPPAGAKLTPPAPPQEVVDQQAMRLTARVRQRLGLPDTNVPRSGIIDLPQTLTAVPRWVLA